MARNEEKAQTLMNRWTTLKQEYASGFAKRRPYHTSDCITLHEAERWRKQVIREMSRKLTSIQNAGLGEHVIRDLNDDINKLINEKWRWEKRIVSLGGPNYINNIPINDEKDDDIYIQKGKGYKYFGAAKNLPGIKELFENKKKERDNNNKDNDTILNKKKNFCENIQIDYYGYLEEEDNIINKYLTNKENEKQNQIKKDTLKRKVKENMDHT